MRKFLALAVSIAFVLGSLTVAQAQQAPAPAAKPAEKPAEKPAAKASGTVKSASETSLVVEVAQKDKTKKEMSFILDKATKLTKAGKSVTAKDIMVGDRATVSYDDKMMAKSVSLRAPAKAAAQPCAAAPAGQQPPAKK